VTGDPEIRIVDGRVAFRNLGKTMAEVPLDAFVREIAVASDRRPALGILPPRIRFCCERRDAMAVVIEVEPQARTVSWLTDESKAPFGRGASYRRYFLSFPYIILLVVFRSGGITGFQQLYYRTAPLGGERTTHHREDEELLLPNLYNVAEGHGQRCWLCLQFLPDVSRMPWPEKIDAIVDHVFSASFNQSSERHEGNSYWGSTREIDPRVQTLEAWEKATRENHRFALEVPWKPAGETATGVLMGMLDRVAEPFRPSRATDLAGLLSLASRPRKRR
jgi:hypothetical protein